jgi:hypothetical protein
MRRQRLKAFLILFVLSGAALAAYILTPLSDSFFCRGAFNNIHCYAHKSVTIQLRDDLGFGILEDARPQLRMQLCRDVHFATDTLSTSLSLTPNSAHETEELSELVDHILIADPECLLKAAKDLPPDRLNKLRSIIRSVEDDEQYFKSGGRRSLASLRGDSRYAQTFNVLMSRPTDQEYFGR